MPSNKGEIYLQLSPLRLLHYCNLLTPCVIVYGDVKRPEHLQGCTPVVPEGEDEGTLRDNRKMLSHDQMTTIVHLNISGKEFDVTLLTNGVSKWSYRQMKLKSN